MNRLDRTKYLNRTFAVSVVIAMCAGGNLGGLFEISQSIIGPSPATRFLFYAVVVISICLGLMSPQWLVRNLTRMTTTARRWLRPNSPDTPALLPARPVDTQLVAMVLAATIIVHAMLSIAAILCLPFLTKTYQWLDQHFLLAPVAMRLLDSLFLIVLLCPAWFVAGITLALLYRLALSAQQQNPAQPIHYEQNLPLWLMTGLAVGGAVWTLLLPHLGPLYSVWLSQLLATLAVTLLIAYSPSEKPHNLVPRVRRSSAEIEHVQISSFNRVVLVALFAILAGVTVTMFKHLTNIIWPTGVALHAYDSLIFIAVLIGLFIGSRLCHKTPLVPLELMAPLLLTWAASVLLATAGFGLLWPPSTQSALAARWCYALLFGLGVFFAMAVLSIALYFAKQITQETAISKSLGWARWLTTLGLGFLLGWYLAIYQLLPTIGSLMALGLFILTALLAGGLLLIYQKPSPSRTIIAVTALALAVTVCLLLPALSRRWLQPRPPAAANITETDLGAWALWATKPNRTITTADVLTYYRHPTGPADAQSKRNAYWLSRILPTITHKKILLVGLETNLYPPPALPPGVSADYLLPHHLAQRLRRYKVLPASAARNAVGLNIIDVPLDLWSRSDTYYNLIWQRVTHSPGPKLSRLLHPEGTLLLQFDNFTTKPIEPSELAAQIPPAFLWAGVLTPTPSGAPDESQTVFVIAFTSQNRWQRFLARHGNRNRISFHGITATFQPLPSPSAQHSD